jgi:hypothetical protein
MKESSFRNIRKEPFEKNQHKKSEDIKQILFQPKLLLSKPF